jgi:hypothetical protein
VSSRPVEHTPDGHHVVIDGRRWRATDPAIPESEAAVLRRWLMAARRDVGTATRAGDTEGESAARSRVHAAKIALGERGPEWWSQSDDERRERRADGLRRAADEGFHPRDTDV